ncbi:CBS domain protein [Candidatus Norongarragalina meridionalis]|nr:CBS domain protein [Candidatus Norongarragalina meridionalis]
MKKVRDVMRKGFLSIDHDATVRDACAAMAKQCKPVMLVLDDGKLAGILTDGDLLRAFYLKVSSFARGDDEFYKMK